MERIALNHDMIVSCILALLISSLRTEPSVHCAIYIPYHLRQILFPLWKSDYISVGSVVLRVYAVVSVICCGCVLVLGKTLFQPDYITMIMAVSVGHALDCLCWILRTKHKESRAKRIGVFFLLFFLTGCSVFLAWLKWMVG